jgi:hypothetical protein
MKMIANIGLLVMMLVASVPAVDLPDTAFDESETPINVAISQTPSQVETLPVSRSTQIPVRNWTRPSIRPERVPLANFEQWPGTRLALALFCTLLC